ncbi:hypothetical protein HOK76_07560 [archaeon]|nr:hypothetical protein [archaeon]
MKVLKNWFVHIDKIKTNVLIYGKYILSQSRHPGQIIEELTNKEKIIDIVSNEIYYREMYQEGQKGRKVSNGREIIISLPDSVSNDLEWEEWNELRIEIFFKMYKSILVENRVELKIEHLSMEEIELAAKTLTNQVYSVIHNKNHIHNIVPTIFFDKEVNFVFNRLISKKKYSYRLKQDLDEYLERKLGISKKTYIVEQVSDYKPKRTKLDNKYQIKLEELKKMEIDLEKQRVLLCEELEESKMVSIDLKNVLNRFEVLVKDYKDKLSIKEQQKVDKLLLRTKKQLTNENTNRAKSTINQMLKVLKPK